MTLTELKNYIKKERALLIALPWALSLFLGGMFLNDLNLMVCGMAIIFLAPLISLESESGE